MNKNLLLPLLLCLLVSGCGTGNSSSVQDDSKESSVSSEVSSKRVERDSRYFINYKYKLSCVANIHDHHITEGERLDRLSNINVYTDMFDSSSYFDFSCTGDTLDQYCKTTFFVTSFTIGGLKCNFYTSLKENNQLTTLNYVEEDVKEELGEIYVYTPYWVRLQIPTDCDQDGIPEIITFEFWKETFNTYNTTIKNLSNCQVNITNLYNVIEVSWDK